ncbi:MAG: hypothetical protein JWQ90_4823 [Hydrocarboniphaga sp.]|nr:hypothetical protein [Hydrocarboniphaga sp.]
MMQDWADLLDRMASGESKVTPIRRGAGQTLMAT